MPLHIMSDELAGAKKVIRQHSFCNGQFIASESPQIEDGQASKSAMTPNLTNLPGSVTELTSTEHASGGTVHSWNRRGLGAIDRLQVRCFDPYSIRSPPLVCEAHWALSNGNRPIILPVRVPGYALPSVNELTQMGDSLKGARAGRYKEDAPLKLAACSCLLVKGAQAGFSDQV